MNTELITKVSRAKYLHTVAKLTNRDNHEAQLLITTQGGTFKITPELIAFLSTTGLGTTTYTLDIYDNPIKVVRKQLLADCIEQYNRVMESWWLANEEINKQR